jgi:hypothetical protein
MLIDGVLCMLQEILGCALMGQFIIVVLGVASVLSPVIVLRLAILVLGFQVLHDVAPSVILRPGAVHHSVAAHV